mgnify:CR=1 FL=1
MNMKTRNFLLTGLVGLSALTACTNEDGLTNSSNQLNEGETYAQIVLNLTGSKATSRATDATGDTDAGTTSEQAVQNLTVVLADANNYVQAIYGATLKKDGTDPTNQATEPFKIPAGKYKVYVLANYNAQTKEAFNETLAVGAQMDRVFTIADASKLHVDNNFLMANDNLVTDLQDFTGKAQDTEVNGDLKDITGKEKTVHKVSVNIERIVAKVELDQTTTTIDVKDVNKNKIASATLEGAALINLNKYMYMVREATAATSYPSGTSGWIYPKDPNYDKKLTGAGEEAAWLTANFSNPTVDGSNNTFTTGFTSATFYCPENTMQADAQQNGQTTGVVYKVTYAPESTAYTELAQDATSTYDQIFTAILGLEEGKDVDINASIFKTAESDSKTFYTYNNLIFKNKKAAILYQSIAKATGSSISEKASAANTAFASNKDKSGEGLDAIKVYEYTAGVSYYTAWVKHNPDGSNMQQDKFGVVRNHWYVLTVSSISGLGYHKPTFKDPKDPDDKAEANIQVAATIKDWTVVKQQVDL